MRFALFSALLIATTPAVAAPPRSWKAVATPADRDRLRHWRDVWVEALAKARASGAAGAIAQQGALLDPDAGLPDPAPPPGNYRCRAFKLGAQSAGLLDYVAYPFFRCWVGADGSFRKLDGSQRPVGQLYPAAQDRLVFLGALALGDERRAQRYGRDAERDMIGAVERIGPRRWRLVLPRPRWESLIDVMELVPN